MIRHLFVFGLAATVAACASSRGTQTAHGEPPASPTTQFAVTLTHAPDEILLAPHATGLSPAQASAIADLVERWRDAGDGPVTVQTPTRGGAEAYHAAAAVQGALLRLGVLESQIRLIGYDASATPASGDSAVAPIMVGFTHYQARGPQCGRDWQAFTKTFSNQPNSNFGCAVTANFAAMIANPADLAAPRPTDPADANRRETILGKYRRGEATSSSKDSQASGAVSTVLQ
jgi:pilus assembly protein CpaD